ncbi:MAG: hypothetical protein HY925_08430 [Elusimicrobia bacterium]|nr:hypothetical protein [Elusimicrobiota bacterium]
MERNGMGRTTFGSGVIALGAIGALAFAGAASFVRGPVENAERLRWPESRRAAAASPEQDASDRLPALRSENPAPASLIAERVGPSEAPVRRKTVAPAGRLGEPPPIAAELLGAAPDAMRDAVSAAGAELSGGASSARVALGGSSGAFFSMPSAPAKTAAPSAAFHAPAKRRLDKLHSIGVVRALPTRLRALSSLGSRQTKTTTAASAQPGTGTPSAAVAAAPLSGSASASVSPAAASVTSSASGTTSSGSGGLTAQAAAAATEPTISPSRQVFDMNFPPREIVFEVSGLDAAKTTVCYEVERHPLFDKPSTVRPKTCENIGAQPYIMPFMTNGKYGNKEWTYENGKWIGRLAWDPAMWATNGIKTHFVFADATTKKKVDGYIEVVQTGCNVLQCGQDRKLHYGYYGFSPAAPPCNKGEKLGDACSIGAGCAVPVINQCPIEWAGR